MSTYMPNESVGSNWVLIDARELVLGRLASHIAHRLRGKHLAAYAPHAAIGDNIVVINAQHIQLTGQKAEKKRYYRHSGYPGGIKESTYEELTARHPTRALELAVKGMLPRGPLGRRLFGRMKVYAGAEHPHAAQEPQVLDTQDWG